MKVTKECTLANPAVLAERVALLEASHIAPLEAWRKRLTTPELPVPHVDPLDGGVGAKLLLLLETPGPGKNPLCFVSRDNATGTAANLRRFFAQAGIAREDSVLWNAVPWIIHAPGARNRSPKRAEIAQGLALLPEFLDLLPNINVVVLAGKAAAMAEPVIRSVRPSIPIFRMPHPSPTYVCTSVEIPKRIVAALRLARDAMCGSEAMPEPSVM